MHRKLPCRMECASHGDAQADLLPWQTLDSELMQGNKVI